MAASILLRGEVNEKMLKAPISELNHVRPLTVYRPSSCGSLPPCQLGPKSSADAGAQDTLLPSIPLFGISGLVLLFCGLWRGCFSRWAGVDPSPVYRYCLQWIM